MPFFMAESIAGLTFIKSSAIAFLTPNSPKGDFLYFTQYILWKGKFPLGDLGVLNFFSTLMQRFKNYDVF